MSGWCHETSREAALLTTLGEYAVDHRLLPFRATLLGALDKVRGALSGSAQHELLEWQQRIRFVGIPAPPIAASLEAALERAWFERQPLRLKYRNADGVITTRLVRLTEVVLERTVTLLNCDDLDAGARRQFRLDRIVAAQIV